MTLNSVYVTGDFMNYAMSLYFAYESLSLLKRMLHGVWYVFIVIYVVYFVEFLVREVLW